MSLSPLFVLLTVLGVVLLVSGARKKHLDSASIGGCLIGAAIVLIGVDQFYIFQHADETFRYFGTALTEVLLGIFVGLGMFLVALSLTGYAMKRFFWQYLVPTKCQQMAGTPREKS